MSDDYFAAADGTPTRPGEWSALLETTGAQVAPGIVTRPVAGENVMLTYVVWDGEAIAPTHAHPEEQILLLIEGEVELAIGDESRVMHPGDVAVIPAFAAHGGRGIAPRSIAVEGFGPPRTLLLELARER